MVYEFYIKVKFPQRAQFPMYLMLCHYWVSGYTLSLLFPSKLEAVPAHRPMDAWVPGALLMSGMEGGGGWQKRRGTPTPGPTPGPSQLLSASFLGTSQGTILIKYSHA